MPDSTTPKKNTSNSDLGITFNAIHSDEPHQEIDVKKTALGKHPQERGSHLSGRNDVFDVTKAFASEREESGTIVSDRKHTRPTLSQNIKDAFSEWWGNTKHAVKNTLEDLPKQKIESPIIVSTASKRTEIIKEAAKHGVIAPKDDHRVVIEKFKTFHNDVARVTNTPIIIKERIERIGEWKHELSEKTKTNIPEKKSENEQIVVIPPSSPVIATRDFRETIIAPVVGKRSVNDTYKKSLEKFTAVLPQSSLKPKETALKSGVVTIAEPIAKSKPLVEQVSLPSQPKKYVVPVPVPEKKQVLWKQAVPEIKNDAGQKSIEPSKSIPSLERPHQEAVSHLPETIISTSIPLKNTPLPEEKKAPVDHTQQKKSIDATILKADILRARESVKQSPEKISISTPPTPVAIKEDVPPFDKQMFHSTAVNNTASTDAFQKQPPLHEEASQPTTPLYYRTILTWTVLGGIVLSGVTLAIFASMYFNVFEKSNSLSHETITITSFFTTQSHVQISLDESTDTLLSVLRDKVVHASTGSTQFNITQTDGESTRVITGEEFLTNIGAGLHTKTIRALEETFMVGSISTTRNEPFIILQSYNFDVLFSGFLAWEKTMYADLSPFFGTPEETQGIFIDAVGNNKSIRILKNTAGEEILLYTFINQNTVVITQTGEALAKLIELF